VKLNKQQEEVANHVYGPAVVLSAPGSGKTSTITERTVRLINNSGISPNNLLCLTFTNKAAKEMRERIADKLPKEKMQFFIGTFHSLCASVLRRYGDRIGYTNSFTIFSQKDQEDMIISVAKHFGLSKKDIDVYSIMTNVNNWRENLETDKQLYSRFDDKPVHYDIAKRYLEDIKKQNIIDFSGLLYETVQLFKTDKVLLSKFQEKWKFAQIDESQDTNYIQFYLVNLISEKYKNIVIIGDVNQCLIEGTDVRVKNGHIKIEDIKTGDKVIAACPNGTTEATVSNVFSRKIHNKKIVKIITEKGNAIKSTPDHIHFAGFSNKKKPINPFFVYLMYKKELGYRIGVTRYYSGNDHVKLGFKLRLNQEGADKIWVLKTCNTEREGRYWEQYFCVKYSIPSWVFKERKGTNNTCNQNSINKLFKNLDTFKSGENLLKDFMYYFEYPHHAPKCMSKRRRRNFAITLCGDRCKKRVKSVHHRYSMSGSCEQDKKKLLDAGLNVRKAKTAKGWRLEGENSDMASIYTLLDRVESVIDVNVTERACFGHVNLSFFPASELLPGMLIYVYKDGKIEEDVVKEVSTEEYSGYVYDINVEKYHNFVANDIVTHNSIYKFRGSRYQNILDFIKGHKDCKQFTLGNNYRSTPQIVSCADKLIKHNSSNVSGDMFTGNKDGSPVNCSSFEYPQEEATWIANRIQDFVSQHGWAYSDCAILYRLNSLSLELQTSFTNQGLPFIVIGGPSFFDRREIRDCVCMLKFLVNPNDSLSFHRIANLFSGIGAKSIEKIERFSIDNNENLLSTCKNIEKYTDNKTMLKACKKLYATFNFDYSAMHAGDCLFHILDKIDYMNILESLCPKDFEDRCSNAKELINSATHFGQKNSSVEKYLQNIALVSSSDKESDGDSVSLMSIHASKGLEFPILFVVGAEQGVLPHSRALNEAKDVKEAIEEERRIFFVAVTRAKKHLSVSYNESRRFRNKQGFLSSKPAFPSQFLTEAGLMETNE